MPAPPSSKQTAAKNAAVSKAQTSVSSGARGTTGMQQGSNSFNSQKSSSSAKSTTSSGSSKMGSSSSQSGGARSTASHGGGISTPSASGSPRNNPTTINVTPGNGSLRNSITQRQAIAANPPVAGDRVSSVMTRDPVRMDPGILAQIQNRQQAAAKDQSRLPGMTGAVVAPAYNPQLAPNATYTQQKLNSLRHAGGYIENPVDNPRPFNGVTPGPALARGAGGQRGVLTAPAGQRLGMGGERGVLTNPPAQRLGMGGQRGSYTAPAGQRLGMGGVRGVLTNPPAQKKNYQGAIMSNNYAHRGAGANAPVSGLESPQERADRIKSFEEPESGSSDFLTGLGNSIRAKANTGMAKFKDGADQIADYGGPAVVTKFSKFIQGFGSGKRSPASREGGGGKQNQRRKPWIPDTSGATHFAKGGAVEKFMARYPDFKLS